jgi:photosynthetic reaction center H subunit
MEKGAITEYIDVAQIALYTFWAFFIGLVFYIRREDRREGYPLEDEFTGRLQPEGFALIPGPKTFLMPEGGTYTAPNDSRDRREVKAKRVTNFAGAPLEPTGDAMVDGVGAAAYCERHDEVEHTVDGRVALVPLRKIPDYKVARQDADPRGWEVIAADGRVAGRVSDIWVDLAEVVVRYLEVDVPGAGARLVPVPVLKIKDDHTVEVSAIKAEHFAKVPTTKSADQVTVLEEEKISAFYAGGRFYADPKRSEPLV